MNIIEKLGITPGPWHINPKGFGNVSDHKTVYATDGELRYVAICEDFANMRPTNNGANARLIAAAPELLEALISAMGLVEAIQEFPGGEKVLPLKSQYTCVLEKATGKKWKEIKELLQ